MTILFGFAVFLNATLQSRPQLESPDSVDQEHAKILSTLMEWETNLATAVWLDRSGRP
jgi:hypothetical protein